MPPFLTPNTVGLPSGFNAGVNQGPTTSQAPPYINGLYVVMCLPLTGAMMSSFPNEDLASICKWLPALQQGMSSE